MKQNFCRTLLLCCLFTGACSKESPPQIIYSPQDGRVDVHFGKESLHLGEMPSAPRLLSFVHANLGTLYLIEFSHGDSCPSQYVALLYNKQYRNLGEIGNCNEIRVDITARESIDLRFTGHADVSLPEQRRKEMRYAITAAGLSLRK